MSVRSMMFLKSTYTCIALAAALIGDSDIRLNAIPQQPTKAKATEPIVESQFEYLDSHQLSVGGSG